MFPQRYYGKRNHHGTAKAVSYTHLTARSTDRHKVKICVIGGVNLDVTFLVDEILGSTETMTIHERSILPGGKAGNQAIGVARLDGAASIISILSNDMDGKNLYNNLAANNVDAVSYTHLDVYKRQEQGRPH